MDGVRLIAEQGHGAVGIGQRLVELALLGVAPGAAVERPAVVGPRRQDLLVFGDGAGEIAFVVEDGGAVVQHVDIVGIDAERGVEIGLRLVEIALRPKDPGAILQRVEVIGLDGERGVEIGEARSYCSILNSDRPRSLRLSGLPGASRIASS